MIWSPEDLLWLKNNYPGLRQTGERVIEGRLSFQMLHVDGVHYINPSSDEVVKHTGRGIYICNSYTIRIEWPEDTVCPQVREISKKIITASKNHALQPIDVHLYPDGTFCLASWQDLLKSFENRFSIEVYVHEYLVPFLFAQTYFSRTKIWLWGELSHGCWGLLEWLGRQKKPSPKDILSTAVAVIKLQGFPWTKTLFSVRCRGHRPCPCGSSRKTRDCHPDIQIAIIRIRGAINSKWFSLDDFK